MAESLWKNRALIPVADHVGVPSFVMSCSYMFMMQRDSRCMNRHTSLTCGILAIASFSMEVTSLSGTRIAELDQHELDRMVDSGHGRIADLKQLLATQLGYSRFRQRIFSEDAELQELEHSRTDLAFLLDPEAQQYEWDILTEAAYLGHLEVLQLLLEAANDKDASKAGRGRDYGLLAASYKGHWKVVRLLLEAGVDRNTRTFIGATALMVAAENGHVEVVRLLLGAGADKDAARKDGTTALHMAAEDGELEVVRLLLEAGADKDATKKGGATALLMAAYYGRVEVVRLLLEAGADKDAARTDGATSLLVASENGLSIHSVASRSVEAHHTAHVLSYSGSTHYLCTYLPGR
ncbi:unnamed protein product [Durusdinium trenchii]|uniref:Ankyrin repeat protein n=1 Tax=Durusdinium trenchii TaxID=1381693 RepID=A0ABP0PPX0_9DINO